MLLIVVWALLILGTIASFWKAWDMESWHYGAKKSWLYVLGTVLAAVAFSYWFTVKDLGII